MSIKKTIQIASDENAFVIQIGGNPSQTTIKDVEGKLLRTSLLNRPHYLTHICSPGTYFIETDGELADIQIKKVKMPPVFKESFLGNIDQYHDATEWYDADESEKLGYIKKELIHYYTTYSFQSRASLIPDYKLQNAVLGVYDEETLASYRTTIQRFRDEFYRIKEAIESAKTLEELKAVKADFPTEIIPAK